MLSHKISHDSQILTKPHQILSSVTKYTSVSRRQGNLVFQLQLVT